ncbi:hypothetical protein [Pseudobutyrivibrio sp.]
MFALLSDEELKEAYGDYRESIGKTEGKAEGKVEDIQNLMNNLNLTAEQAMTALGIKEEDFEKYLSRL